MKKAALLNIELSRLVASLGHNDILVIGDAGLPVPDDTLRIDLALTKGIPGFIETLRVVVSEMQVERIMLAKETEEISPHILAEIKGILPDTPIEFTSHSLVKEITHQARAVVRTGEFTPYANIVLVAGVVF